MVFTRFGDGILYFFDINFGVFLGLKDGLLGFDVHLNRIRLYTRQSFERAAHSADSGHASGHAFYG